MKVLYQDKQTIVIDTENEDKAFPIRIFNGKNQYYCSYLNPMVIGLDEKLQEVIRKVIIQAGRNDNIYLERIKEIEYQISVYEQSGCDATDRIFELKNYLNKLKFYQEIYDVRI